MIYFSSVVAIAAFVALDSAGGSPHKHGTSLFGHDHDHDCDKAVGVFAYDRIAKVAKEIHNLHHHSNKEFVKTHAYHMLESPTASAIDEYHGKVRFIKSLGGDECLSTGQEDALKDFKKRQAKVVLDCEAGWKIDAELGAKIKTSMDILQALDKDAKVKLNEAKLGDVCKPGQLCYTQFKTTTLGKNIDKQIEELKQGPLVDMKVLSDVSSVQELDSVRKCIADGTNDLRKDVYTGIAKMNVCAANLGMLTDF